MEDLPSSEQQANTPNPPARPAKRSRIALACQRCKKRKQKCNGASPSCAKCEKMGLVCKYVIPPKPMPFGKNHYVATLEQRLAELEEFLGKKNLLDQVSSSIPYGLRASLSVSNDMTVPDFGSFSHDRTASSRQNSQHSEAFDIASNSDDDMVRILRDLSLETNGGYIGATSQIGMGRLVNSIVKGRNYSFDESQSPGQLPYLPVTDEQTEFSLSDVPQDVADRLFEGYLKHISTRYPVMHSAWIRDLHSRRTSISDAYESSILHLLYATAGRFLETTGEISLSYFPELHQAEVLKDLDEILRYHDTRSVVLLLLLAVFSLRATSGPGAWTYIGLAMRIAIDLGLHRHTAAMEPLSLGAEMRKRLFWSCYTMDRQVSIPLGRPFAIADQDIDARLPFDVNEDCQDIEALKKASKEDYNAVKVESTSLTAFLHVLRLRRIESSIQQTIYRVDQKTNIDEMEVDNYLVQLEEWKTLIPLDARKQVDQAVVPFDGYDYMIFYYKCHRLLLYPLISRPNVNPRYLRKCAEICGGVAQTYKRLHQTLAVGYSLMALQTVFMAGLTLIYCVWISPDELFSSASSNDINACSIVLFVITERWPTAKKYRDIFEAVKQSVIDPLAIGQLQKPRQAMDSLKSIIPANLSAAEMGDERLEFSRIMNDMLGEDLEMITIQSHGEPTVIDMDQLHFQSGHLLGIQDGNSAQEESRDPQLATMDEGVQNYPVDQWLPNGMDFSAAFEPFELESHSAWMG